MLCEYCLTVIVRSSAAAHRSAERYAPQLRAAHSDKVRHVKEERTE